ncbi:gephyrin isoform X1 [Solenopsis invicta]|uniref:gephyrin isoform X1 n=1 Tax=Solenopsis invicta TaxID=13686 RepID=UPI000E33EBE7|nr:gephyrin isoform X1 [Solenopsis invicta]
MASISEQETTEKSKEAKITAEIIFLRKSSSSDKTDFGENLVLETNELDLLDEKDDKFISAITNVINAEIIDMTSIKADKNTLMKLLLLTCMDKAADIVFITGDIEDNERHYANETIKLIMNYEQHFKEKPCRVLKHLITQMESRLEKITNHKIVCGIRNKTLIINLFNPPEDTVKLFTAIVDMLENILFIILKSENLNHPLLDVACLADNNSLNQIKDKDSDEINEPSSSSTCSLPEKDMDDDTDNLHKELFPMVSTDVALTILITLAATHLENITPELVKISDAYGRMVWKDILSNCNMPPFRISSKHGYAVLVSDGQKSRRLLHNRTDRKNSFPPISLQSGTCVWVNSGSPIPDEATAVVQVKDTQMVQSLNNSDVYIDILIKPRHMQNIKPIGYDVMRDKVIIQQYTRIGPEEIALLAASDCKEVTVVEQLSIGILSIGDNLEEPGEPLKPGYIHDTNRITLISLLKHNGFSCLDFGIVNDKSSSIQENIERALGKVDVLVTTGSINDKDLLKKILLKYFRAEIHFGNVNMKPGKSTTLASCTINHKTKYLLCFSGNPLSAFTAAQVFLLPFVRTISGYIFSDAATVPVYIDQPYKLHHRSRMVWADLQWSDKEKSLKASSKSNIYKDKLYNIMGSKALLILPPCEFGSLMPKGQNVLGLLVDYPCDCTSDSEDPNLNEKS